MGEEGREGEYDPDFAAFVAGFKGLTGIDLALYKEAQMKRRLTTLRQRRGYDTFATYFQAVQRDKELLAELLDRMTINVSEFWRNPNRWEVLENKFIPEMLQHSRRLKCWSAACSTGEEPYSLAMILARRGALPDAKLAATDIDDNALAKAKLGVYHERSLKDVPKPYIDAYFRREGESYFVADELKRGVSFAKGNLLTDAFDTGYDLIICRNVMIYFTDDAKTLLYRKFAEALRPGGILFVGSTEQIFTPGQYGLASADTFFYRKTTAADHV
ncbi:protein-glutamate O-methyltransferase CheR [Paenibacillus antri]|uniref:protein-glutamate O-methyltransferase n=1 Tax=Paenibacillus antri TaxID=2582848 RepID=A0A5R9GI91_9BACL|nr:protein-glutamate O-methyltransferase CheR [Paenibacillus antri]TLS53098.1 protein-glutamate O-methyltransferase CheR [Paenibacillus antri]